MPDGGGEIAHQPTDIHGFYSNAVFRLGFVRAGKHVALVKQSLMRGAITRVALLDHAEVAKLKEVVAGL